QLPFVHPLAGPDINLGDRGRVGGGDRLELARGNDLAFAAGDLVDLSKARPDQKQEEGDRGRDDDHARAGERLPVLDRGADEWEGSHGYACSKLTSGWRPLERLEPRLRAALWAPLRLCVPARRSALTLRRRCRPALEC